MSYENVVKDGIRYAVPRGKTVADEAFVYKILVDSRSQKEYYVNLETHQRRWKLPQLISASNRSYRERVVAIYTAYKPEKLGNVDVALSHYAGKEEEMMQKLIELYGPEPPAPLVVNSECTPEEYEQRIFALFRKHRPTKMDSVPELLLKWKGQEKSLLETLVNKYGPEPEPGDDEGTDAVNTVASPTTNPFRDRVLAIYEKHNPTKVHLVDSHLQKNAGNEEAFIQALMAKYNIVATAEAPPPTVTKQPQPQTAAPTYEQRVRAIYAHYRPGKGHLAEAALEKYKGQEEELIKTLVEKFGSEPPVAQAAPAEPAPMPVSTPAATTAPQPEPANSAAPVMAEPTKPEVASVQINANAEPPKSDTPQHGQSKPQPSETSAAPEPVQPQSAAIVSDAATSGSYDDHPIFAQYASSPPNVKQQLLLSFLNDREARLKEAMQRHEKTTATIASLQHSNTALGTELDSVVEKAAKLKDEMARQSVKAKETSEDSSRLWALEREQLAAQAKVATVAAQRALNETKLQFEEERARKAQEIAELRRRVAEADNDVKAVTVQSSNLLHTLDSRQKECAQLRQTVAELEDRLRPIPCASVYVQTEPQHATPPPESPVFDSPPLEVSVSRPRQLPCNRCGGVARVSCPTCKLRLCAKCDNAIHTANRRFALHQRRPLPAASSPPRRQPEVDVSPVTEPQWLEDAEAAFDAVMAEHETKRDQIATYQAVVKEMEARIKFLKAESEMLIKTGTAPSVEQEMATKLESQSSNERRQIEELLAANRVLQDRIDELELRILAEPERVAEPDTALLAEVESLRAKLAAAQASSKEYRQEIKALRGRLQVLMASPFGLRHP